MKKTILLFAASFVFVAFLFAQHDCPNLNSTSDDVVVLKKVQLDKSQEIIVKYYVQDCANSTGKDYDYKVDRFKDLVERTSDMRMAEYKQGLPNAQILPYELDLTLFSQSRGRLCCTPPEESVRSVLNPKRIQ